ncbi:MAG: hypothetical protein RL391_416 [Actinomycetota bacterium]
MTSFSDRPASLSAAIDLAPSVGALGGAFMLDPSVLGPGKSAGYPGGFSYYVVGRGGVLGDVDASVVSSAFGFFAPSLVRSLWEAGVPVEGARAGADRYTIGCAEWGRTRLGDWAGAPRAVQLLERIIDGANDSGLSLFAGWRAQSRPNDPVGRAYLLMHVLRELRGGVHLVATLAGGLTPLEAVLANPSSHGIEQAKRFGWNEPFPDVSRSHGAMADAERITNSMMARHLDTLSEDELVELVSLVAEAHQRALGA